MSPQIERVALGVVLIVYALLAIGYAVRVPIWLAPDEPAHYNYAAQIAATGCCPVIAPGDWDQAYLSRLTATDFAADQLEGLASLQYEDHQPPLYYLLASVVYTMTGGAPLALRLLSVVTGAGVILCAYAIARTLAPGRPGVAIGTALLVALVPQHLHILASVNNDVLAELLVALTLWRLLVAVLDTHPIGTGAAWTLGALVGVGLLTKVTTLFLVGLVPVGLIGAWLIRRRDGARVESLLRALFAFAIPIGLIGGVWWARNIGVYGFPDIFGLRAHDVVVVGQPRTSDAIAALGVGGYVRALVTTTFQSFWGQFGWMELALPTWAYAAIGAFLAAAGVGWLTGMRGGFGTPGLGTPNPCDRVLETPVTADDRARRRLAWGLTGLTLILALAQFAYYNTSFQQFQGRYIYPGLIPFALFVIVGIDALWRWGAHRLHIDGVIATTGSAAIVLWLAALNLFVLWRVIPGLGG